MSTKFPRGGGGGAGPFLARSLLIESFEIRVKAETRNILNTQ